MKTNWPVIIFFLVVFFGYLLYLIIGMSSTYPSIKEYTFDIDGVNFEKKLAERISSSQGWSYEKTDSIIGKEKGICYWISLLYKENNEKLEYDLKYCLDSKFSNGNKGCVRLYLVGAFDLIKKSGGYKLSDRDVEKLTEKLDTTLLNELAPKCSD